MTTMPQPKEADAFLSLSEVQKELAALSEANIVRLRRMETLLSGNNPTTTLLTDAILKTWEGTRHWKRGMSPYAHLYSAMKSLANNDFKKKSSRKIIPISNDIREEDLAPSFSAFSPSPEKLIIDEEDKAEREKAAQTLVNEIFDLFADDEEAMHVLMGEMYGLSAEEIRQKNGMELKQYHTTRRRISRKINKHYPGKRQTG